MHEDLNFRRLERFLAVLETGSVRRAAEELQLAYQSLSSDITILERALDLQLFDRSRGGGSKVTTAGRLLEGRVRALIAAGERLEEFAHNLHRGSVGIVSIAAYPVHLERFLATAIQEFRQLHPEVSIDLTRVRDDRRRGVGRSLFEELMDGDVDMAMGPPHPHLPGIMGLKAYDARLVVLFPESDPLASVVQVPVEELHDRDIIAAPRTFFSRERLEELASAAGFNLKVVHEGASPPALRALGIAGLGVPVLPDDYTIVGANPNRRHPVLIDKEGREVATPVWLHWRDQHDLLTPAETFIDVARDLADRERRNPGTAAIML